MRLRCRIRHLMLSVALVAVSLAALAWWRRSQQPMQPALPPPWILEYRDPFMVGSRTEVYVHGGDLRAGISPPRRKKLHYDPHVPGSRARSAYRLLQEIQHDQDPPGEALPSGPGAP